MEDTRIETAPTPAHIFAYRAFRSVFVGSPESSPVRPPLEAYSVNHDKENARRSPVRGSRFVTSPVKSKRDANIVLDDLSLTPKRQRTNPVSPTKSILKNPSALTPRRAGLRDVTVTFKDVRLSVSPDLARKGSPTRVRSQPDLRKTLTALSSTATSRRASTGKTELLENAIVPTVASQSVADIDLDAYIAQTEKEMRRLIKYGQKWREYAKKQDEEKARLKTLVEELRKENERLKGNSNTSTEDAEPQHATKIGAPLLDMDFDMRLPKQRRQSHEPDKRSRHTEPEKWKVPLEDTDKDRQRSKQGSLHGEPQRDMYDAKTKSSKTSNKKSNGASTVNKDTANSDHIVPEHDFNSVSLRRRQQQQTQPVQPPNESSTHKQNEVQNTEDGQEVREARVEPMTEEDRKAAARERLRLRREAKGAKNRASFASGTAKLSRPGHDSSRVDNEESQVDWMAMI